MVVQANVDSGRAIQICLVGDGLVGKTCLARALLELELPTLYEATLFNHFSGNVKVENEHYTVDIHDTAGQQDYKAIRTMSYTDCDVIIVCFSMADSETLRNAEEVWVPEIRQSSRYRRPLILVGTQNDCQKPGYKHVNSEEAHTLARTIRADQFVTCSAFDNDSVMNVFKAILQVTSANIPERRDSFVKRILKRWR